MIRKIQYQNKVAIDPDIQLPAVNKVTDNDMNEIKSVVNANSDELQDLQETTTEYVTNTDTRMNSLESSMANLEDDVSDFEQTINGDITDIETSIENITRTTYTKTETNTLLDAKATTMALGEEVTARENADTNLQRQIDSIVASSDVVDIVGTYQDLQNYDTSHLGDNDIIKVLDDNTHNNATSYFRWKKSTSTWQYIGSEGPYYTKSETDTLLNGKVNVVSGKGLSTNDFTNADKTKLNGIEANAQVNKIETIKVNNVTQTITSKSVNISVPTKTSDLSNDSDYVSGTDYATSGVAGVIKISNNLGSDISSEGVIRGYTKTYSGYTSMDNAGIISKGTLENVLNAKIGDINNALDLINGESI